MSVLKAGLLVLVVTVVKGKSRNYTGSGDGKHGSSGLGVAAAIDLWNYESSLVVAVVVGGNREYQRKDTRGRFRCGWWCEGRNRRRRRSRNSGGRRRRSRVACPAIQHLMDIMDLQQVVAVKEEPEELLTAQAAVDLVEMIEDVLEVEMVQMAVL